MLHEIDDLRQERQRVEARPSTEGAPPVLTVFDVVAAVDPQDYIRRVRSVLSAALDLAITESFDDEDLPTEGIPEWFAVASGAAGGETADFSRRGMDRYHAAVNEKSWDLQWWLFEFDPDNEFRGWAWWDATQAGDGHVRVWTDSWGESFFACDELRWLLYTAGADEVSGPVLADTSEWAQEITEQ
ncbi:hypothetical protein EST92_08400 [Streptomyces sp. TM32]|uniref:hypothetical protein n=1 Tax=Streptomyces sp. TM32 TaxID=1652669 RepID=UPI001010D55B|nr:hypothetical protein [Streptomyces sp. TM32]RXS85345.1 hypothetical protein EST92_08400 [Streptomyces sp. TM32]